MRRALLLAAAVACLTSAPSAGGQGSGGGRGGRPAPLDGLDSLVAAAVRAWEVPGLAIAVVADDSIVFARGYGTRTVGRREPVDANTLFAVGSTTKAMTATALAMLVDEGKLRWDDLVIAHMPELRLADPYVTRELTVRDLLTHRSGLGGVDLLWYGSTNTFAEIERRLRWLEPESSLRSSYAYQNVMYAVAGELVGRVSGVPWDRFLRERIFAPLGMTRAVTSIGALAGMDNVATPHDVVDDTLRAIPWRNLDAIAGAGAVNASAMDMARWIRFQLDSGKAGRERLLSPASWREMLTPQFVVPRERFYPTARLAGVNFTTYGLGWFLHDYRGHLVAMHTGSIDGMTAIVGMIPGLRAGVVVLANRDHAELRHALMLTVLDRFTGAPSPARDWSAELRALYGRMRDEARAARAERESRRVAGTKPSLPLAAYAGAYADSLYGAAVVRLENGRLTASLNGGGFAGPLEHWHFDTFRARWTDRVLGDSFLTFVLAADGTVRAVRVEGVGEFGRVPDEARGAGRE
jgi:CubicO group peptidase (beta-lactamase class C family)